MRKKLYGTAKYLNKVYTQNGGEANYEDNEVDRAEVEVQ